jgi:hypothetical protein
VAPDCLRHWKNYLACSCASKSATKRRT